MRPRISLIIVIVLTAGVFISDAFSPLGYTDWLLYLIPLFMASRILKPSYIRLFSSVSTILIILGFFISPHNGYVMQDFQPHYRDICAMGAYINYGGSSLAVGTPRYSGVT